MSQSTKPLSDLASRQPKERVTIDGVFAESVARRWYGRFFSPASWYDLPVQNRVQLIERAWDLLEGAAEDQREQELDSYVRRQVERD